MLLLSCSYLLGQKYNPNKEYRTTWNYNNLKGKIKSVTTKIYYKTNNDSIGNLIKHFNTDTLNNGFHLTAISNKIFNNIGLLQQDEYNMFYLKNNQSTAPTFEEVNDDKLMFIPKIKFSNNTDTSNVTYKQYKSSKVPKYDSLNRLVKLSVLGSQNEYNYGADFVYDNKNNLITSNFFGYKERLDHTYNNKYDAKDSLIETEHYNYAASEFANLKYKYNPPYNWQTFLYLNDGNVYRKEVYETDKNGDINYDCSWTHRSTFSKRHIINIKDNFGFDKLYKYYDDEGKLTTSFTHLIKREPTNNLLVEEETNDELTKKKFKYRIEYKFDSVGNIIEEKQYNEDNNLVSVTLSSYEYF